MAKAAPVDFAVGRVRSVRVASIVRVGPWKVDNLRTEFGELVRWAQRVGVRTGRWIFIERGHHRWEACLEVAGRAAADGRIRLRTLPAARVARVVFDPEKISSRIVYHGLRDWVRTRGGSRRGKGAEIREVYSADPWKSAAAWARCEVQFLLGG
jgi:hypothetical protein